MRKWKEMGVISLVVAVLGVGCGAPPSPGGAEGRSQEPAKAGTPKRIVAAIHGTLPRVTGPGAAEPGREAVSDLVNTGLINFDNRGVLVPRLAEEVPSVENGLWRVLPDGRMEVSWKIRSGAQWHDGRPVTSDDLAFTVQVGQDKELPEFGHAGLNLIEGVDRLDGQTLVVKWRRPYIDADAMFKESFAEILPRHLLDPIYRENKPGFLSDGYWTDGFVGTGAFKLRQWVPASHMLAEAFEGYLLGRPKVDIVEVRFIPDSATMMANILAGEVDLTMGRAFTLEEAVDIRNQWPNGKIDIGYKSWIAVFPQFIDPNPTVILDVRFRRALLHAIDRQALADTFQGGLVPIAHSFLNPSQPQYRDIEARLPRYDFNPRKATESIEALGYTRGADGVFRDAAGRRLEVELRTIGVTADKAIFAVADYWKQVGVWTDPVIIPAARTGDTAYRATFPGFQIFQNPNDVEGLDRLHPSKTPLPENNFRVTGNHSRYNNPEFTALVDRFNSTIPKAERTELLGQIIYHIADQLNLLGLYYGLEPTMIAHRLQNVTARHSRSTHTWNAHEWDLKS